MMTHRLLRAANMVLVVTWLISIGHLIYHWNQLRPRIVINPPVQCGATPDFDADNLARIYQEVINATGPLPKDPVEAARVVADNAPKLGLTWPNNFKVNAAGEILNCGSEPFQISVGPDRVTVTSPSLYAFYFAELDGKSTESNNQ